MDNVKILNDLLLFWKQKSMVLFENNIELLIHFQNPAYGRYQFYSVKF